MSRTTKCFGLAASRFVIAVVIAWIWGHGPAVAQETPAERPDDEPALTEQSIYIPYKKLREVFERQGRGVFVPYEQFSQLWQAARDGAQPPTDDAPPVEALLVAAENEATVTGEVVQVISTLRIDVFKKGWVRVPLRLHLAAITQATIGGQPARILFDPASGYELLYEHKLDEPQSIELKLQYAKTITKALGRHSVSFQSPQAPVSRWRLTIPEPGVNVNLHPMIATTQVPSDPLNSSADKTTVLAFVGAAQEVRIDWMPKAEGAIGLAALADVQTRLHLWIEESVARVRADLLYKISRAQLPRLTIEIPADYKVTNVADANIRQWSVETTSSGQQVVVDLFEPAQDTQAVTLELEQVIEHAHRRELTVPLLRALGVVRQQGTVAIKNGRGLRCEVVQSTGVAQLDVDDLGNKLHADAWDLAYRYVALPFALVLEVEKIRPAIVADLLTEARLRPQQLDLEVTAIFDVQRAGVFRFELDLPGGYELDRVQGAAVAGANPVAVDAYHLDETNGRLVVSLSRKALGKVALGVGLSRRLDEPDLLTPTGKTVGIDLSLPRVTASSALERQSGRLILYAPEALRIAPKEAKGLRGVPVHKALEGITVTQRDRAIHAASEGSPVAAFVLDQGAEPLPLAIDRRQPHSVVRQLLAARILPGVIRYQARFSYGIRYSGVETLRIDVPAALAESIHNNATGVRAETLDPQPTDVAAGYVAWSFTGQQQFLGPAVIQLNWEEHLGQLDVGKRTRIHIPKLVPKGIQRAWGQVVIAKAGTIDVEPADVMAELRPIDPDHDLMPDAGISDAAKAYEFHSQDWALAVSATHYQLEPVKRTSIEKALVRTVVTRSDQIAVQALYRVRSARQRLRVKLPEGVGFDTGPLRINGKVVALERGDQDEFLIPLVGLNADTPFVVDLRYTVPGGASRLDIPVFEDEPAVQKVYLSVYVPQQEVLMGSTGPWSQEMRWRLNIPSGPQPMPHIDDGSLISWITSGVSMPSNPGDAFQTDGQRYLFSTLRPLPPPGGALRLVTLDQTWLQAMIFIFISLGGTALLKTSTATRWLGIGSFVVALILIGVFLPTFSLQILDAATLTAVFLVWVIWTVHHLVWVRPRVLAQRAAELRRWTTAELATQPGGGVTPLTPQPHGGPTAVSTGSKPKRADDDTSFKKDPETDEQAHDNKNQDDPDDPKPGLGGRGDE